MHDKLKTLKEAAAHVKSGTRLVMSANMQRSPMAFLREVVRQRADPVRAVKAEAALKGKGIRDAISAACKEATDGAQPLGHNGYKVDAAKGILEEALVQLA